MTRLFRIRDLRLHRRIFLHSRLLVRSRLRMKRRLCCGAVFLLSDFHRRFCLRFQSMTLRKFLVGREPTEFKMLTRTLVPYMGSPALVTPLSKSSFSAVSDSFEKFFFVADLGSVGASLTAIALSFLSPLLHRRRCVLPHGVHRS